MKKLKTIPYYVPLGDQILMDCPGKLEFTNEMCAMFSGGPAQTVSGHVWVTETQLVFRPVVGMTHPHKLTAKRQQLTDVNVVQPKWFGLIPGGKKIVEVTFENWGQSFILRFHVHKPKPLSHILKTAPIIKSKAPSKVLSESIDANITDRDRYTHTLSQMSFPEGYWYVESVEDLVKVVTNSWERLGVPLCEDFLLGLDLNIEVKFGPEDYETGPGSESWARREQICRICLAANDALDGERRFYDFEEDLEDWEFDQPVWLFLTPDERKRLISLGILHPLKNQEAKKDTA